MTAPAQYPKPPHVPGPIIDLITAYGDARADDGDSASALRSLLKELRAWPAREQDRARAAAPDDNTIFDCGKAAGRQEVKDEQQCADFGEWIKRAYRDPESSSYTIHNMEVAYQAGRAAAPIDMVLHCPKCGLQHIDHDESPSDREWAAQSAGDREAQYWTNPPHRSHLCHGCGHIWRPADVPTNGVAAVKTTGKADSPIAAAPPPAVGVSDAQVDIERACVRAWDQSRYSSGSHDAVHPMYVAAFKDGAAAILALSPASKPEAPALFRALLIAERDATIDVSGDIARQEAQIDLADHLLVKFNELFPEAPNVRT